MNDNMKRFLCGMLTGLASKGVMPSRKPVAYLYNGVRLPKLPEWDKVKYPYAVIGKPNISGYRYMWMCSERPYYDGGYVRWSGSVLVSSCNVNKDTVAWIDPVDTATTEYAGVFWTNTDILYEDGTVYLSASDPIPVYE